jgi:hypothetical protein
MKVHTHTHTHTNVIERRRKEGCFLSVRRRRKKVGRVGVRVWV